MTRPSWRVTRVTVLRRRATAWAVAALGLLGATAGGASAAAEREPAAGPVRAPHYGDTLFDFYQSKYFSATTRLMSSQHFNRLAPHADEAELLRGGMLLSYGLHTEAGAIFAKLAEATTTPAVRHRAWFFLAKQRFQRGLLDDAFAALQRIDGDLPGELREDHAVLAAHIRLARGDTSGAVAALEGLPPQSRAARLVMFNLGVALVKDGRGDDGRALLDRLGTLKADDEEQRVLRDKANVALGFAALHDDRPAQAREVLQRVRLTSLQANKALLALGWAQSAMKDQQGALVPWTELLARDGHDAASLEARLAVPYAYAELGARAQALQRYEDAVAAFEREHDTLERTIATVRDEAWLKTLAADTADGDRGGETGSEMGWFWTMQRLPRQPHAEHLAPVMAEHAFQEAFKNYRDLRFLERNLAEWRDKLGAYDDMLAVRRAAFAQRAPRIRERAGQAGLEATARRAAAIDAELDRAQADVATDALANDAEHAMQQRLDRARAVVAAMGAAPDAAAAAERLRLAQGALTWQLAREFPARVWEARKAQRVIHAELTQARERAQAIEAAQRDEPTRFDAFARRIATLDPRVTTLTQRVQTLTAEQGRATQAIAVAALQAQQQRLVAYVRQARYAIAQLHDHAATVSLAPTPSPTPTKDAHAGAPN